MKEFIFIILIILGIILIYYSNKETWTIVTPDDRSLNDILGHDIGEVFLPQTEPLDKSDYLSWPMEICGQACDDDIRCKTAIFGPSTSDGRNIKCHLKDIEPGIGWSNLYKNNVNPLFYPLTSDTKMPNDIDADNISVENLSTKIPIKEAREICLNKCLENKDCLGVVVGHTINNSDRKCYLKSGDSLWYNLSQPYFRAITRKQAEEAKKREEEDKKDPRKQAEEAKKREEEDKKLLNPDNYKYCPVKDTKSLCFVSLDKQNKCCPSDGKYVLNQGIDKCSDAVNQGQDLSKLISINDLNLYKNYDCLKDALSWKKTNIHNYVPDDPYRHLPILNR